MPLTSELRYAKTDGPHIAYQVVGDGPVDLLEVNYGMTLSIASIEDQPVRPPKGHHLNPLRRAQREDTPMFEYKIHTQRDKALSGAFDPQEVEAALNAHAADGWRLAEGFMVSSPWKSTKSEIVLILERPIVTTGPTT